MAKYVGVSDERGEAIEAQFKPQAANIPPQPQPLNLITGKPPKGFVPDVNQAITRATGNPINAPVLKQNQTQYAPPPPAPVNGVASEVATTVEKVNAAQKVAEQPKDQKSQIQDYLMNVFEQQQGMAGTADKMRQDAQLKQKEEKARKLSDEITARERAYTKQVKEIEKNKQGKFGGAIQDELDQARKEYNSEQADLSIQYNVALGDFQAAEKMVEKQISDIEKSYTNQIETLKTAYTLLQNDMTDSEKLKAQQEFQTLQDEKNFEQQKQYASYQQTLRENDPMYQLQLQTERLQQANINSQIAARGVETAANATGTGKPPTIDQNKVAGFASRINQASTIIDEIGSKFTGAGSVFGAKVPEIFKNQDRKSYEQAQRNFINAVLRRESGAVISDEEFANARMQYFPQPGDSSKILEQKKANRDLIFRSFEREAGNAVVETANNSDPLGLFK